PAAPAAPAFVFAEAPPKLEDFLEPETADPIPELKLSAQLTSLEGLWSVLSDCLLRLGRASDPHAILVLQPAAEAFFLVHAVTAEKAREAALSREQAAAAAAPAAGGASPGPAPISASTSTDAASIAAGDEDTTKLLQFAEKHRSVLNQVLRQNQASLQDGPFAILAACPKLLDFDVKRTHFRKQLGRMDDRQRYRRDDVPLRIRRAHIFSDSFRELFRLRGNEWKSRFYIMFEGEEGQDAGGLLREWFSVITREIFNPNYALFNTAPGDRSTYMINKASYINPEHLDYFKFVGRIIAKAIHDNKLLDCYFTRAFYKHILNLPVKYQDLESEDPEFYKSFDYLLNNPVETMGIDLTFTLEVEEFGVVSTRPLKEGGADIIVTDENKEEYVRLVCQMKMTSSIRRQLDAFLDGFYDVIPKTLIAMFNEQELELLISGLPDVDIDDLAANTEYRSYTKNSKEIQWFWRALRSFEPEDRAKFLQFVTGTSKVPLNGFTALEGMNGAQKFSIHQDSRTGNRLPAAHTCFNQLDLPVYDSYEKLREALLLAIRECTEGFGFA
ncbi:eel-1, partial [Pristionchus pacificus]